MFGQEEAKWREEIEKYLPQLRYMSFCGVKSTIRWLMSCVDIKPEHKEIADKMLAIEHASLSAEQKINMCLVAAFPNLREEIHHELGGEG